MDYIQITRSRESSIHVIDSCGNSNLFSIPLATIVNVCQVGFWIAGLFSCTCGEVLSYLPIFQLFQSNFDNPQNFALIALG